MIKTRTRTRTTEQKILTKAFAWAGIAFLLIAVIGAISFSVMDNTAFGSQIHEQAGNRKFNVKGIYSNVSWGSGMSMIVKLSLAAFGLIIISSISSLIWAFRVMKASKTFIFLNYVVYIIANGISFGFLFLTMAAMELVSIFGIAGGIFVVMAAVGYFSKDLSGMGRYLFFGVIFIGVIALVNLILTLTGVWNKSYSHGTTPWLVEIMWIGTGILMMGFTAYDVWRLKRMSEWAKASGMDKETSFRLTAYFGFRLLTDLVGLIWTVARFYMSSRR